MSDTDASARLFARAEALAAAGRAREAAAAFRALLDAAPGHVAARRGLAAALRAAGDDTAASEADRAAARLEAENMVAVGKAAAGYGKTEAAIASYERALALAPDMPEAVWHLAEAQHAQGQPARALASYRRYLALRPGSAEATHMIAALGGGARPDRAPDRYVVSHFDRYAADYDRSLLADLGYRGPELLYDAVTDVLGGGAHGLDVVDLGCGTGLAGVKFRALAATLAGIDLSGEMLALARARGIYDSLQQSEICAALAGGERAYDLALAADVFCYIGELAPVFAAVARALRPGGHLAFTVEWRKGPGWRLGAAGRYAHNPAWLRKAAQAAGLAERAHRHVALRTEYGRPVAGYVSVMARMV